MQSLTRAEIPGLQHPSPEDDARGLFRLSPAVLPQIHRCTMHPDGSELVVVGPVDPDAVVTWATLAFGKWKPEPVAAAACAEWLAPAVPEPAAQARLERARLLLIFGLREDPWITLDVPGPSIDSPDYLPFEMLSKVLAERSAGSAKELRHAGATYGIHFGTYDRYPSSSLLEVHGQLDAERAQSALRSLIEDIRGIAQHLEAADLEAVKRRWRTETVDSWAHGPGLAGAIQWQLRRGGAPEDLAKILDEGRQIDVARCREVADRYLTQAQPAMAMTGLTQNLVRGLAIDAEVQQLAWTSQMRVHSKGN
jgi:predicted Zn-dependent peptidase